MRDLLDELDRWRAEGVAVAVARVVDLDGSGPRAPGAAMAVNERGEVVGSVSGGCVEGAVVTEALEVLRTGDRKVVTFGYSDDDAFAVGLTCGGTIHLSSSRSTGDRGPVRRAWRPRCGPRSRWRWPPSSPGPGPGASCWSAPASRSGTLGDPDLDRVVARDALGELAAGTTAVRHYGAHGEAREAVVAVFVEAFAPPPRMLVFGAVDFTAALVRVAKVLGYRVTVCDAREVFATRARFPQADEVVVDWPDRLLGRVGGVAHPPRRRVRAHPRRQVRRARPGGRARHRRRLRRRHGQPAHARRPHRRACARRGSTRPDWPASGRPIGLDVGARTPEETAVSICAEIIAHRTGRIDARPLRDTEGPIHREP